MLNSSSIDSVNYIGNAKNPFQNIAQDKTNLPLNSGKLSHHIPQPSLGYFSTHKEKEHSYTSQKSKSQDKTQNSQQPAPRMNIKEIFPDVSPVSGINIGNILAKYKEERRKRKYKSANISIGLKYLATSKLRKA